MSLDTPVFNHGLLCSVLVQELKRKAEDAATHQLSKQDAAWQGASAKHHKETKKMPGFVEELRERSHGFDRHMRLILIKKRFYQTFSELGGMKTGNIGTKLVSKPCPELFGAST